MQHVCVSHLSMAWRCCCCSKAAQAVGMSSGLQTCSSLTRFPQYRTRRMSFTDAERTLFLNPYVIQYVAWRRKANTSAHVGQLAIYQYHHSCHIWQQYGDTCRSWCGKRRRPDISGRLVCTHTVCHLPERLFRDELPLVLDIQLVQKRRRYGWSGQRCRGRANRSADSVGCSCGST